MARQYLPSRTPSDMRAKLLRGQMPLVSKSGILRHATSLGKLNLKANWAGTGVTGPSMASRKYVSDNPPLSEILVADDVRLPASPFLNSSCQLFFHTERDTPIEAANRPTIVKRTHDVTDIDDTHASSPGSRPCRDASVFRIPQGRFMGRLQLGQVDTKP